MKHLACFRFAFLDLIYKSKNTIRTSLCFFLLQIMVIIWLLISSVLPRTQANHEKQSVAYKYLVSNVYVNNTGSYNENSEGISLYKYLQSKDYICAHNPMFCSIDLIRYAKQENRWRFVNCDWLTLTISNNNIEMSYGVSDSKNLEFNVSACGNQFFYSESEYSNYISSNIDSYEDAMICGEPTLSEKEIIIPDKIMRLFVNDESQWRDMLGKSITIKCKNAVLIENYTLKGVYDHRFYISDSTDSKMNDSNLYLPVYIRCDSRDLDKYGIKRFDYVLYCKEGTNYIDICNDVFGAGYINTMPSDEGSLSVYAEMFIAKAEIVTNDLIMSMGSVISVAIILYLATMIYIEKKTKSESIGILKAIGIENKNIILISCFQQIILSCIAVLPSCIFTILAVRFLNSILDSSIGLGLDVSISDYVISSVIGVLFTVFAGILLYLPVVFSYLRHSPAKLLNES